MSKAAESALVNADRRLCARKLVPSLVYVEMGENNGGIIVKLIASAVTVRHRGRRCCSVPGLRIPGITAKTTATATTTVAR